MSDLSVFCLTGDPTKDCLAILTLIEETFLEARFDSESNHPGVMHQQTLERIQGAAGDLLRHFQRGGDG